MKKNSISLNSSGNEEQHIVYYDEKKKTLFLSSVVKYISSFFLRKNEMNAHDSAIPIDGYTQSQEEKELVEEMCSDITLYYELKQDLKASGKTPEQWYIDKMLKIDADCSEEEITLLNEIIDAVTEEELLAHASNLEVIAKDIYEKRVDTMDSKE